MSYKVTSMMVEGVRHAFVEIGEGYDDGGARSGYVNLEGHSEHAVQLNSMMVQHIKNSGATELFTDPMQINVDICTSCDMHCPFCPYHGDMPHTDFNPSKRLMDMETIRDILGAFANSHIISLGCSGEPFLHPKLPEIVDLCYELHPYSEVHLSTDGLRADRFDIPTFFAKPNIRVINFSIDTLSAAEHQSWTKVKNSLNTAQENLRQVAKWKYVNRRDDLRVIASSVLKKSEIHRIGEIIDFYQPFEIDYLGFQNYIPPDRNGDETLTTEDVEIMDFLREIQATKKSKFRVGLVQPIDNKRDRNYCSNPWNLLTIDPDRNISPCCNVPRHPRHGGFEGHDSWNNDVLARTRETLARGDLPMDYCINCWANENPDNRLYIEGQDA